MWWMFQLLQYVLRNSGFNPSAYLRFRHYFFYLFGSLRSCSPSDIVRNFLFYYILDFPFRSIGYFVQNIQPLIIWCIYYSAMWVCQPFLHFRINLILQGYLCGICVNKKITITQNNICNGSDISKYNKRKLSLIIQNDAFTD